MCSVSLTSGEYWMQITVSIETHTHTHILAARDKPAEAWSHQSRQILLVDEHQPEKKYFREWNNINFWPAARMMMRYNIKLENLFHFAKTFLLGFHWSSGFQSRVRLQLVALEPPLVVYRGITFPIGLVGLWVVLYTAVLQYIHTGSVCDGDGGSEVLIYFILF